MNTRAAEAGTRALHVTAALIFAISATVTAAWCGSMTSMPGMDMPGGWTMSMAWMRMPEQGWWGHFGMFIGMWAFMMVAMMMPVLAPMLAQYRQAVGRECKGQCASLTASVAGGYFAVWMLLGLLLYPPGVAVAQLAMAMPGVSQLVPVAGALVVFLAGALQFSAWKRRQLAGCRNCVDCCRVASNYRAAWRLGLRFGLRCVGCCAGLTAVLLAIGVMDLLAMVLVTMAISAERLMPAGERMARVLGVILLLTGTCLLTRAQGAHDALVRGGLQPHETQLLGGNRVEAPHRRRQSGDRISGR